MGRFTTNELVDIETEDSEINDAKKELEKRFDKKVNILVKAPKGSPT